MQKNLSEIAESNNANMKCILTKFQQDYFRECGMKQAFNCILKIYLSPENGGYSKKVLKEIFLESDFSSIISDFSIIEIVEKMKSYEEKKIKKDHVCESIYQWEYNEEMLWWECSECCGRALTDENKTYLSHYCPHCGAKMKNWIGNWIEGSE